MRIAIDARKLHDFGIGTYVHNLLVHLARLDQDSEYVVLCRPGDVDVPGNLGPNFRGVLAPARPYSAGEQVRIPWRLRREHATLFHTPHYVLPPLTPCRSIVTIHDCIHLLFPQYLPNRLAHAYARTFLWAAARRADLVLTVSEASKRDILRYCHVPEHKVVVISNAIDERFATPPTPEQIDWVRNRYQLEGPMLLYVGNIKPHKNVERLIEAFRLLRGRGFDDVTLLVIGDDVSKYASLRRAVHRYKLHRHVRFLGFVPHETLAVLYRLATAFVFPSLYEGFGLPPLEAMASGTPVVTSNVSSLPEVVGDAAVLIDPYDPAAIADGIEQVLADAGLRERLRERGLERVAHFSWERSIRRVWEIYRQVGR